MKTLQQLFVLISCLFFTHATHTKKAIVIGASSGMGREVAKLLSNDGYEVGLVARRFDLLESLQKELPNPSYIQTIDVAAPEARAQLIDLIAKMGELDLIVISVTAYLDNRNSANLSIFDLYDSSAAFKEWPAKERTLDVDAKGFIAMADVALAYFERQNHGHLVGISSMNGQRGVSYNPVYSAAKACISYYMEAQRNYMIQNDINVDVTDIVPGWVAVEHSPLGADPAAYWEITVQQAGKEIFEGIKRKDKTVYIPSKVWFIAYLLKYTPDCIYNKYLSWI